MSVKSATAKKSSPVKAKRSVARNAVVPILARIGRSPRSFRDDSEEFEKVTTSWDADAQKAWYYYKRNGRVKDAVDYFISLAIGENTLISCEDAAIQEEARQFFKAVKGHKWLRGSLVQALVKGDATSFMEVAAEEIITRLRVLNPLSIVCKYDSLGNIQSITQNTGSGTKPITPIEQFLHTRYDAPEFEEHGSSMVLPAFDPLDDERDTRMTDRAINRRYREPIVHWKLGGERGKKYYSYNQTQIDKFSHYWDHLPRGSSVFTQDTAECSIYGIDGKVPDSEARYERLDLKTSYALGLPRAISSGDGPNRETAQASSEKVLERVAIVRELARELLDWVFGKWLELNGYDVVLDYGRVSTDPWVDLDVIKIYLQAYTLRIVSRQTILEVLKLNVDQEQQRLSEERRMLTIEEVLKGVELGVLSADEARAELGFAGAAPERNAVEPTAPSAAPADDTAAGESPPDMTPTPVTNRSTQDAYALYASCGYPFPVLFSETDCTRHHSSHSHSHTPIRNTAAASAVLSVFTPGASAMEAALALASKHLQATIAELQAKMEKKGEDERILARLEILQQLSLQATAIGAELTKGMNASASALVESGLRLGIEDGLQLLKAGGLPNLANVKKGGWNKHATNVFATLDRGGVEAMNQQTMKLAGSVSQNLMQSIHQEIQAGIAEGASLDKVAARIGKYIDDPEEFARAGAKEGARPYFSTAQDRVRTIVRTETARARDAGAIASYSRIGTGKIERDLAPDCCSECAALGGKQYEIGKQPQTPLHPNDRCGWLPVIDLEGFVE